jgi:DNA gyrase subunit A
VRAKTEIEEMKSGRFRIIVTEIPYQVNKTTLIERIAALVREGRLDSISGLRDESDRNGMRIVIELKRGAVPRKELNKLFKYTFLQTTFGVNNLALVNNEPHTLSLKRMLMIYIDHRMEVITRRTRWELSQAEARLHILEGLRIALDFLDEVIKTIRGSRTVDEARSALMEHFGLTEIQAQAILDMPLRRLAALERQKIEDEYNALKERVDYLNGLLADPHKILMLIRKDILYLRDTYADERRTRIDPHGIGEFREEDLITQRGVIITLTQSNYIKRTDAKVFRAQGRGGKGVKGVATKAEDIVVRSLFARTLDHLLFFTNAGRVYSERAFNIPEGSRTARGYHVNNVLNLQNEETVTAVIPVADFEKSEYIVLCTRRGRIKRMTLSEFARVRPSGIIAMNIPAGDELISVEVTHGDEDIVIVTRGGKVLRFHESAIRPMGRTATGVRGIRLLGDDLVTAMTAMDGRQELLIVTEQGWGKRVAPEDIAVKGRYNQGVWITDHSRLDETGPIMVAMIVNEEDDVAFMTRNGIAMRTPVKDISILGRATRGVRCVRLQEDDALVSAARIEKIEEVKKETPAEADDSPEA